MIQRTLFAGALFGCLLLALPARADDWSVKRSGFDPRLVNRYKALLHARPNDGYALARLVKLYKQHRSVAALIAEYRGRARRSPNSFAFQVIVGHLYRRSGQKEKAIEYYERAAKLRPKSPSVPAALGALYRRIGQHDKAKLSYKKALSLATSTRQKKRYLRQLATMALTGRNVEEARGYFKALVRLEPRNVFLRIELAQALARAKLRKEAIAEYQQILKRTSESSTRANVLKEIGALQHELGKSPEAIATYRKAMRLSAHGHWIRRELTDRIISIYREKEELKKLIAYYLKHWKRKGHFEWQVLGRLYDETGDEAQAMKAYRAALKRNGRAIDTRVRLIALLERSGHDKEVIAEYRKLARIASGEPRYQLELAKRLHRAGNQAEAVRVLEVCGRRFGRDASVHSALADLFARWGEQKRALREARILVSIEPKDDSHLLNLGEQYFLRGQKRKAIEIWKRILTAIPQRHKAFAKLAAIYGDHDMTQEAVDLYRKAIKRKPKFLPYHRSLALLLERKRRHTDAIKEWGEVLTLARAQKARQSLREARTHTIDILHRSYRLRHYIRQNERSFAAIPPDLEAGFFLAEAYRKQRNFKQAQRVYERIVSLSPKNLEALLALEQVYRRQRRFAQAVVLLKKLVDLDPPRRREYYQRIASLQLLLYKDREALIYAHKAVALGRQDARSYQRLGELYEKKEDFKGATDAYEKALKISPNLESVHFALARLHTRAGNYDAAEKAYRRLIRTARTPELVRRAFRKGVVLSSYLERLEKLEKELIPLAVRNTQLAETYRRILVQIYRRRVPTLMFQARQGSPTTRRAARRALAKIGIRGMAPLLEELANPATTASRRGELIRMLGYLGNTNAAVPLLRLAEKEPTEPPLVIRANRYSYYRRYGYGRYGRHGRSSRSHVDQRVEATIAVGRLADPRAIPGLIRLLASREGGLRDAAAWALAHLKSKQVHKALFKALGDQRANVQMMACAGLGVQRDPKLRPVLEEVMLDGERNERVRAACAWGLGVLGDPRASESLLAALGSGYDRLQRCAAWSLGALRDQKAMPNLIQALWSRKPRVRNIMLWALMRMVGKGSPARVSPPDVQIKYGSIDAKHFVDRLTDAAERSNPQVLAQTLGALGAKHQAPLAHGVGTALKRHRDIVLRVLADLDADPDGLSLGPLTAARAQLSPAALQQLDATVVKLTKEIVPLLDGLVSHRDALVRRRAASVAIKVQAPSAIQRVLGHKSWQVRVAACETLLRCAPCRQRSATMLRPYLERAQQSKVWREREASAALLGLLPGTPLTSLTSALADANGFVREAAVRSLGSLGGASAAAPLRKALADEVPQVRVAAIEAAARLRLEALRALVEALLQRDPAVLVRKAATKALAAWGATSPAP